MNFFEHQHKARRKTGLLVGYFLAAVVLIVVAVNVAIYFILQVSSSGTQRSAAYNMPPEQWLHSPYWIWISGAVLAVIAGGTLASYFKIAGGGQAVAAMVGARLVDMASREPRERVLVNVVEEMSIASGTPSPLLYVMDDEDAINAFVAGYKPSEAVLVVTRGALETLSRDELQGVIGHEYSHILNGDMRLNVRLIAILAGILLIGQLGGFLLRSAFYSGSGRRRSRGRGDGKGVAMSVALGLALLVIGYIGVFFGRLIKAAVSRQREFLADASSVQFTRNPAGIAGALWKIKNHEGHSRLDNAHAEDMSHMCFGVSLRLSALLSTHPPLDVRIKTVDPSFMARAAARKLTEERAGPAPMAAAPAAVPAGAAAAFGFAGGAVAVEATAAKIIDSVGSPRPEHMDYARQLHAAIPAELLDAAHEPQGARETVYALVLAGTNAAVMDVAWATIKAHEGEDSIARCTSLLERVGELGARCRLPLLDIAMPTLRAMTGDSRRRFLGTVQALVKVDKRVTLFEFAMMRILEAHLGARAGRPDAVKYYKAGRVMPEIRLLLSAFARAGAVSVEQEREAFTRVMGYFESTPGEPAAKVDADGLTAALAKLSELSPLLKRSVITACADCVLSDGKVMPVEAELLRATALTLDCPMSPLIPG